MIALILAVAAFSFPENHLEEIDLLPGSTSDVQRIYFLRHGQSVLNLPTPEGNFYLQGQSKTVPLTEFGERQAEEIGSKLLGKFAEEEELVICASTAKRAQDTADRVFAQLSQHYKCSRGANFEGMLELSHADWEGRLKDVSYKREHQAWKALSAEMKFTTAKCPNGESYADGLKRAMSDLQKIGELYRGKTVIAVTHYNLLNALMLHYEGHIPQLSKEASSNLPEIEIANCALLMLEISTQEPAERGRFKMLIY